MSQRLPVQRRAGCSEERCLSGGFVSASHSLFLVSHKQLRKNQDWLRQLRGLEEKSSCGKKHRWRHGGPGGLSHCPRAGCTETVWQMGCLETKLLEVPFCKRELCLKDSCNEPTESLFSILRHYSRDKYAEPVWGARRGFLSG